MKGKRRHAQQTPGRPKKSRPDSGESDDSDVDQTALFSESENDEDFFERGENLRFDDNVEEVLPITNEDDEESAEEYDEHGAVDDEEASSGDEDEGLEGDRSSNRDKSELMDDEASMSSEDGNYLEAWGKKKGMFFNADFVDEDRGRSYREEDMETAKAEEKDALAIQKNFMSNICPSALAITSFPVPDSAEDDSLEITGPDWKLIDKAEKFQVLQKKSPELVPIMHYFKDKLSELKNRMLPLARHLKKMDISEQPYLKYISVKTQLLLHYCMNASFYMTLKSLNIQSTRHPVVKKLNDFKKLLDQFEPLDQKLNPKLDKMLKNFEQSDALLAGLSSLFTSKERNPPLKSKLEECVSPDLVAERGQDNAKIKPKKVRFETETEKEVLSGYMDAKERKQKVTNILDAKQLDDDEEDERSVENSEEIATTKRSISYQIAKNKGLIPRRKKEYRNPRVRHRMKFKKAEIRRKGQVRLPRKEIQKYGGELSGISANVTKSIKIK